MTFPVGASSLSQSLALSEATVSGKLRRMAVCSYVALLASRPAPALQERPPVAASAKSELEWQAHWFAGDFGREFTSESGERVELVQFGVWNHEGGPDFREAAVRFPDRPGAPTVRGAVELDLAAEDWERHGHAGNPAFAGVVLHLFFEGPVAGREFWTRTVDHRNVPQVRLDPRRLEDRPAPVALPAAKTGRCSAPLRELSAAQLGELLAGAARHRLEAKRARFERLAAVRGGDEALFQALAAALGYKENTLPFTLLAQRLPLESLRAEPPETATALLFGLSGFLQHGPPPEFADTEDARETRAYLRGLWERWWTRRDALTRLVLPADAWTLGGQRPANHPQRRVAALGAIVRNWPKVRALAECADPARETPRVLGELSDPFWEYRYTLTSARSPKPLALVGETRAVEILANVVFPLAVTARPALWTAYEKLTAKLTNRRVETAAARLFGEDEAARHTWTRTVVHQQGLLQVYEDFCLRDASDCARCPLPERLRAGGPV